MLPALNKFKYKYYMKDIQACCVYHFVAALKLITLLQKAAYLNIAIELLQICEYHMANTVCTQVKPESVVIP